MAVVLTVFLLVSCLVAPLTVSAQPAATPRVGYLNANRRRLVELAAKYRLPAVYEFKDYVADGGLMSYGPSVNAMFRGLAGYVDRILRGARPGDLPVERATKFELALNLRTARTLGLTIPQSVLAIADDVIQ
jgi:putative ABC transport system substrate-binding protein